MPPEPARDTAPQALRDALRRDLVGAMKARELDAVSALRTAIAAIDNAEAVPAPETGPATTSSHIAGARAGVGAAEAARRDLSGSQQRAILRDQVTGYTAEADRYEALGQQVAAARLRTQARLLSAYLLPALAPLWVTRTSPPWVTRTSPPWRDIYRLRDNNPSGIARFVPPEFGTCLLS